MKHIYTITLVALQDNSICTYNFAADQQFFQGDQLQNFTLSAVVKVDCHSGENLRGNEFIVHVCRIASDFFCEFAVGTFRRYVATEYCMSVADVTISGLHFDDETIG